MRLLYRLTHYLLFALVFACSVGRADEQGISEAFRARIAQGVESGVWQGVALGLIRDGVATEAYFGHAEGKDGEPLNAHSRVELGPLSEAYVGLLLADLVIAGKVRLGSTLSDALSEEFVFSDAAVGQLSFEQLAVFRSGLPGLPPNLFPRSVSDPFLDFDSAALRTLLAHTHRQEGAGGGVLDVALLAFALERSTGGDVAALLRSRILAELGLDHTGFGDGELVGGHDLGESVTPWHYAALTPARGLRSDLADQLKFAQAWLRPGDGPLQAALLLARQPRGDAALGWHVLTVKGEDQDWPLLWNGGTSGGHASFIGLRPDLQRAVVLLGNASADLSALGLALLTDAVPPALPPRLRRLDASTAGDYSGLYRFDAKDEVIVRSDGDGLTLQRRGQFPLRLVAYDDDAFLIVGVNAQVTFHRDGLKHVESLLLHQGGVNLSAVRLSQRAPLVARESIVPDEAELAACAGDFALGTFLHMHLARQGNSLTWQLSGAVPRELIAFAPHRFASSDGALELLCSADDKGMVGSLKLNLGGSETELPRVLWTEPAAAPGPKVPAAEASSGK